MAEQKTPLKGTLIALAGIVVGWGLSAWHWSNELKHSAQDALQVSVQRNLALRSEIEPFGDDQTKRHLESFLASDLQTLNTIGSSKGPQAAEAIRLQKEVASWRARHSSFTLTPQFSAEVDRAIANVR